MVISDLNPINSLSPCLNPLKFTLKCVFLSDLGIYYAPHLKAIYIESKKSIVLSGAI